MPSASVRHDGFSRDAGYSATARLLAEDQRPECVFAVTDVMAIGAIAAIQDAGLRPGIDVAVAGFDNIPLLRDLTPRLTTVALPLTRIGADALELALSDDTGRAGDPGRRRARPSPRIHPWPERSTVVARAGDPRDLTCAAAGGETLSRLRLTIRGRDH